MYSQNVIIITQITGRTVHTDYGQNCGAGLDSETTRAAAFKATSCTTWLSVFATLQEHVWSCCNLLRGIAYCYKYRQFQVYSWCHAWWLCSRWWYCRLPLRQPVAPPRVASEKCTFLVTWLVRGMMHFFYVYCIIVWLLSRLMYKCFHEI